MSSVYRAQDSAAGDTEVAVKILDTPHGDEIKQELFKREAGALTRIHRRYDVTAAEWAIRGKRRRWSGHDFWQLGLVSVFSRPGRPCDRLGTLGRARWRGEDAARGVRGPDWREFAGAFGWPDGGSVADGSSGWEWNRSQPCQGATELGFPRPALWQMQGEAACRAGEPSG